MIPIIYVGLYGHIEILYTTDLTHSDDTTTWSKEVFSGPSNQFETTKHSHEMTGLQPDKEYFLKVIVVIKNTKNIDSSKTITVKMPPLRKLFTFSLCLSGNLLMSHAELILWYCYSDHDNHHNHDYVTSANFNRPSLERHRSAGVFSEINVENFRCQRTAVCGWCVSSI